MILRIRFKGVGSKRMAPQTPPERNWLDDMVDWLDSLDVPKMNVYQKFLVGLIITIVLLVIVTTMTGHFYLVAVAFTKALDGMSLAALTTIVFFVVAAAEVVGVNTTMLALAVGYIYGRRYNSVAYATMVKTQKGGGGLLLVWPQYQLTKRCCWQFGSPFVSH